MADRTEIAWCDATWNPIRGGCTRIAPGCVNCYAERMMARGLPGLNSPTTGEPFAVMTAAGPRWTGKGELIESQLEVPLHWKRPRRIFVNSISDTFHKDVPDEWIDRIFAVMALCPRHTFIVLTKRGKRMREYMTTVYMCNRVLEQMVAMTPDRGVWAWDGMAEMFKRIWLGVSASTRPDLDAQIEHLRATPAAVRFLSLEPLIADLGTIDLSGIGWVIVGGESGPGARPMHPDWVRSIKDQCVAAHVPFFFKQWGEWLPSMQDGAPGDDQILNASDKPVRVGKKSAGRLFDGREWNELPGGPR